MNYNSIFRRVFRTLITRALLRWFYGTDDLDRVKQAMIAFDQGYFWMPCHRCKKLYGGQEPFGGTHYMNAHLGKTLCKDCVGDSYEHP